MTVIQSAISENIQGKNTNDTNTLSGSILYEMNKEADTLPTTTGYYFDIVKEHSINVQNQITDNYLENNTAVQDHIAQAPITVTLRGLIGEKVFTPADAAKTYDELLQEAQQATTPSAFDKLHSLEQLYPPISNLEQIAWNAYDRIKNNITHYGGIIASLVFNNNMPLDAYNGNLSANERQTKLQAIFSKLLVLRLNNSSFVVETPFKSFQDMYIESLSFVQGNENYIADIEITLKQINFAQVTTTKADEKVMAQYNAWARATEENNGTAQGKKKSIAASIYDGDTNSFSF